MVLTLREPSGVVWGPQSLEHREVPHVAGGEIGPELLRRCCHDEIGTADPRMALPPTSSELTGPPRDRFVEWHPTKLLEEALGTCSFSAAQAAGYFYPRDFAAGRYLLEPFDIVESGFQPAEDVDDDGGVNDCCHARRRCSISS